MHRDLDAPRRVAAVPRHVVDQDLAIDHGQAVHRDGVDLGLAQRLHALDHDAERRGDVGVFDLPGQEGLGLVVQRFESGGVGRAAAKVADPRQQSVAARGALIHRLSV